ncbi:hypothetical protein EYF80_059665 [Liparis tanakae]|uniref:Uncharacterized protein n=1 Tax=Liparis tanakae TaxID=230148 RepID=A0A4Z2EP03_9TELE|nr:hypothetical protein EYF80_059665 [Liparis tanakae]
MINSNDKGLEFLIHFLSVVVWLPSSPVRSVPPPPHAGGKCSHICEFPWQTPRKNMMKPAGRGRGWRAASRDSIFLISGTKTSSTSQPAQQDTISPFLCCLCCSLPGNCSTCETLMTRPRRAAGPLRARHYRCMGRRWERTNGANGDAFSGERPPHRHAQPEKWSWKAQRGTEETSGGRRGCREVKIPEPSSFPLSGSFRSQRKQLFISGTSNLTPERRRAGEHEKR